MQSVILRDNELVFSGRGEIIVSPSPGSSQTPQPSPIKYLELSVSNSNEFMFEPQLLFRVTRVLLDDVLKQAFSIRIG